MTTQCRMGNHPIDKATLRAGGEVCYDCATKTPKTTPKTRLTRKTKMAKKTTTATTKATTEYLTPIIQAAELLQLRAYPHEVERLTTLLDRLNPHFPQDTMPRLEALRAITTGPIGSVEELDILEKVWPDYSGDVRYKLTATTLTRQWSSKHSGIFATITVPFPTMLPMQIEVKRYCDMDEEASHSDACPVYHPAFYGEEEAGDDCNCENWIDQTVTATITDWNDQTEAQLGAWLAQAVIGPVEPATFPETTVKTTGARVAPRQRSTR